MKWNTRKKKLSEQQNRAAMMTASERQGEWKDKETRVESFEYSSHVW